MRLNLKTLPYLHVAADAALVSLGWLGAYALRHALDDVLGTAINPRDVYIRSLPLVVGPWIFTCWLFGIYRSSRMKTGLHELQALLRGVALGLLVVSSISLYVRELQFGRSV